MPAFEAEDMLRKAAKLEPNKKSGKLNHTLYKEIDDFDQDDDELYSYKKKESTFDYFDDGNDDEEYDDDEDQEYDDDDEYDQDDQD